MQGRPSAKPGRLAHRQVLPEPTQVVEVKPEDGPCGQRECPETTPYYTHQMIELPSIQVQVTYVILYPTRCLQCGSHLKALLS
jgi:transposase